MKKVALSIIAFFSLFVACSGGNSSNQSNSYHYRIESPSSTTVKGVVHVEKDANGNTTIDYRNSNDPSIPAGFHRASDGLIYNDGDIYAPR